MGQRLVISCCMTGRNKQQSENDKRSTSENIPSPQKHMKAHQFCRESDMDAMVLSFTTRDLSILSRLVLPSVGDL